MSEREEERRVEAIAAEAVAGDDAAAGEATAAARPKGPKDGLTPEQAERLHALTHPDGDPYTNARELGFYCEQCG